MTPPRGTINRSIGRQHRATRERRRAETIGTGGVLVDMKPKRSGRIEYLKEGFILHWDEHLLTVEVIDYHATVLRLPWKDLQALATIASGTPLPNVAKPRSRRNPPREV